MVSLFLRLSSPYFCLVFVVVVVLFCFFIFFLWVYRVRKAATTDFAFPFCPGSSFTEESKTWSNSTSCLVVVLYFAFIFFDFSSTIEEICANLANN